MLESVSKITFTQPFLAASLMALLSATASPSNTVSFVCFQEVWAIMKSPSELRFCTWPSPVRCRRRCHLFSIPHQIAAQICQSKTATLPAVSLLSDLQTSNTSSTIPFRDAFAARQHETKPLNCSTTDKSGQSLTSSTTSHHGQSAGQWTNSWVNLTRVGTPPLQIRHSKLRALWAHSLSSSYSNHHPPVTIPYLWIPWRDSLRWSHDQKIWFGH